MDADQRTGELVARLRELALATRLKRLSDRLFRDVSLVYRELHVRFEARWFPLMTALGEGSGKSMAEVARELGLTHPAVVQLAREMRAAGLVRIERDADDERRRPLALTARGAELARLLAPVWDEIRSANADLLDELRRDGHDLLAALEAAERLLAGRSMHDRVTERLRRRRLLDPAAALPPERLQVLPYRPAWRKHFETLNRAWLEEQFEVEPHDAELLADPNGRIVKPGGMVFFARLDGAVVGTCALVNWGEDRFELAKMAVTESHRRHGIGRALYDSALREARARGARTLFLETSPRLIAVRRWYERLGFRRTEIHPGGASSYRRRSICLTLDLSEDRSALTEATA